MITLPTPPITPSHKQALKGSRRHSRCDRRADELLPRLDPVHEGTRPRVDRLEDDEHDRHEHDQAGDAMRQKMIDAVAERGGPRLRDAAATPASSVRMAA